MWRSTSMNKLNIQDLFTHKIVNKILQRASHDKKGDYRIYNAYKHEIEDLVLSPKDYEQVIRELTKVLKV